MSHKLCDTRELVLRDTALCAVKCELLHFSKGIPAATSQKYCPAEAFLRSLRFLPRRTMPAGRGTLRSSLGHRYKSREPRVSCHNLRKTLRLLLQRVLSPDFPTMTREHLWAPPHHTHRHLTFLAPHERLPEIPVVPREIYEHLHINLLDKCIQF